MGLPVHGLAGQCDAGMRPLRITATVGVEAVVGIGVVLQIAVEQLQALVQQCDA